MLTARQREVINAAINQYDHSKNLLRRVRGYHPAIKALKSEMQNPDATLFSVINCFDNVNLAFQDHDEKMSPSVVVYKEVTSLLGRVPRQNVKDMYLLILGLKNKGVWTPANVHYIAQADNSSLLSVLKIFFRSTLYFPDANQELFCQLADLTPEKWSFLNRINYIFQDNPSCLMRVICFLQQVNNDSELLDPRSNINYLTQVPLIYMTQEFFAGLLIRANHPCAVSNAEIYSHYYNLNQAGVNFTFGTPAQVLGFQEEYILNRNQQPGIISNGLPLEMRLTRFICAFLAARVARVGLQPAAFRQQPAFNERQSTHTESVHRTVSESAVRLRDRYQHLTVGCGLEEKLKQLEQLLKSHPNQTKVETALASYQRMSNINYLHVDKVSGVSARQLLALVCCAVTDETTRVGTLEDAIDHLVDAFWQIEREYNLNENGIDENPSEEADSMCAGGAYNKIVERLVGVCPDCVIEFITLRTAALKFQIVIAEEVNKFLLTLSNPLTKQQYEEVSRLISELEKDGMVVIWKRICETIKQRMLEEFSVIFVDPLSNQPNEDFARLISAGKDAAVPKLDTLKAKLQESVGFRKHVAQARSRSGVFNLFSETNAGQEALKSLSAKRKFSSI